MNRSLRRHLAWLPALTLVASAAQAALSYDDARNLAVDRAPLLAARRAAVESAEQQRINAAELPDPKLIAGVDNLPVSGMGRWTISGDPMTQRSVGWMQDMPNAAKRAARAEAAGAKAERERRMLDADRLMVRREVAMAWLMRHYAERRVAAFGALIDENRLLIETLPARIASGKAMPTDLTMARQDALMLADRRDELERERAQAQATLARWLGDAAAQPLAGDPPALDIDPPALRAAIDRQPELMAYEPMRRMAQADLNEAKAMRQGDWGWQVMYSRRNPAYGDMVSFQLTFELPLFAAKRQDPQIAAKAREMERVAAEREDLMARRREEVDQQLADLAENSAKLARLRAEAVPLAAQRVTLAMAAYEAGRGDLAAVLAARRERAELVLRELELAARAHIQRARLSELTEQETR